MTRPVSEPVAAAVSAHGRIVQLHALTSLRFFAAILVVAFHFRTHLFTDNGWETPSLVEIGYSGVTFFFILSGFILAYNYWQTDFSRRGNLSKFVRARIARIYPVYVLSLLVALPFYFVDLSRTGAPDLVIYKLTSLVLAPLALQAWVPGAACALNCPSWSISNEFFFYALLPLVIGGVLRAPIRWLFVAVAGLTVVGVGTTALWTHFGQGSLVSSDLYQPTSVVLLKQFIKMFPAVRMYEFIFGIVLFAGWRRYRDRLSATGLLIASLAAGALLCAGADRVAEPLLHNGLTAIVWAPLILAGAQMRSGPLVRRSAAYFGKISFSLYLLHTSVLSLANSADKHVFGGAIFSVGWIGGLAAIVAALIAAAAAFHFVEEPMRKRIMRMCPATSAVHDGGRGIRRPI